MWIEREIEKTLVEIASKRPALILTGSRQAGKTSLLCHVYGGLEYIALDVPNVGEQAESSGEAFLAAHPAPIILDEVQHAPGLLPYLKSDIDAHRDEPGRYLLTGSQKFTFMQGVTESLAGRVAVLDLHSLSVRELAAWTGQVPEPARLAGWMLAGGYPEVHARDLSPERFYADYLVTYLERDVRSVLNVRSLRDFDRFLRLCAARTGQLMSLSQLATDIGVSPNTIKNWMSVLETSGVILLLEPYYQNLGKRIVKTPKLYFLDTGLACFLVGMRTPEDLTRSAMLGPMFETHVLGQLIRHHANLGLAPQIYFYRDHAGHEVDFVLPRADRFDLIECKWSERPSPAQPGIENFEKLVGSARVRSKTIVCSAPGLRRLQNGIQVSDSVELAFLERGGGSWTLPE